MSKTIDVGIRVSDMGKRKSGDESFKSEDDQRRMAHAVIKAKGWRVGKEFKLLDQSGFTVLGLLQPKLEARIDAGQSHGICFGYGSRLARNWMEAGAFMLSMIQRDAELLDAQKPDSDFRNDRTLWGVEAVMNEMPVLEAKRRSANMLKDAVQLGDVNRAPYGYRHNCDPNWNHGAPTDPTKRKKNLVADWESGAAVVVQRIYQMWLDGFGASAICKVLNGESIPGPSDGLWVPNCVRNIVQNERYTGLTIMGDHRSEKQTHEALVTPADWRRAQRSQPVIRNGHSEAGLAQVVLLCSGCHRSLSPGHSSSRKNPDGSWRYPNYHCRRGTTKGTCPNPQTIMQGLADDYVERIIVEALESEDGLDFLASARELEAARVAWEEAREDTLHYNRTQSSRNPHFQDGLDYRVGVEREAQALYEELLAHAGEVEEWPTDASGWRALAPERQRSLARKLFAQVIVHPPSPDRPRHTPVEERLEVVFRSAGEVAGAR